ncbi:MAG: GldG family protein [Anaerolineae bacterium]|nr:GldG family protein [Anaerolineae bacterium]
MAGEGRLFDRETLGRILSIVGVVALLVALVALIGGLQTWLLAGALVVAVVGIGGWVVLAPGDVRGILTGRRVRYGGFAALTTVLFIGVLVILYVLAMRNEVSIDLTQTQRFSLSDASKQALAGLETPIHIVGFYSNAAIDSRENAEVLLRQYNQTTNGLVTYEFIDPDLEPTTAAAYGATRDGMLFAQREGDAPQTRNGSPRWRSARSPRRS